jgi:hypothetical protein
MPALPNLGGAETDQKLLRAILFLFAPLTFCSGITDMEIETIVSAIQNFVATSSFLVHMVQILAGANISTTSSNFIIRQPQALKLMISVYSNTSVLESVINVILSLGRYSRKNIAMCFEVGLELFLLEHLEKAKITQQMDDRNVQLLLDLLGMLISQKADVKTVFRFLGLLRPFDDLHISRYHPVFLRASLSIIETSLQPPQKFLLLDSRQVNVSLGKIAGIERGFTFAFWLFIQESSRTYRPELFRLRFGENRIVGALNDGNITMSYESRRCEFQGTILKDLSVGEWIFITIGLQFLADRPYFQGNVNCRDGMLMALLIDHLDFLTEPLTLSVGGTVTDCDTAPARMVQCGLFPLLSETGANWILEKGLVRSPKDFIFPITPFHFFWDYGKSTAELKPLFLQTIAEKCGISVIFPLFRSVIFFSNGTLFDGHLSMAITLLSLVLQHSSHAQVSMFEQKGPNILRHLLQTQWSSQYSFKNYLQFVELMMLIRHDGLRRALFHEIVVNFSLLCALPTATHLRILKHWYGTLLSESGFAESLGFANVLSALRLYFYVTPSNSGCCLPRNPELAVTKCREVVKELAIRYGILKGVSANDFRLVLCHCLDSTDDGHATDILRFVIKLVKEVPAESISFDFESTEFSHCFLQILQRNVAEVPKLAFQFLCNLLDVGLIVPVRLCRVIHVVVSHFLKPSVDFFEFLLSIIDKYPIFQAFCCSLVLKLSQNEISLFVSSLNPKRSYILDPGWLYWHLALCTFVNKLQRRRILSFIAEVAHEHWELVFFLIDCAIPTQTDLVRREFLEELTDFIPRGLNLLTTDALQLFFGLAQFFIFTGRDSIIRNLFRSVYNENFTSNRKLSLRLTENGEWIDCELASKVIRLYLSLFPQNYLSFVLFLVACLCRIHHPDTSAHLLALNSAEGQFREQLEFVQFVEYHSHLGDHPDPAVYDRVYTALSDVVPDAEPGAVTAKREWVSFLARCESDSCELLRAPFDPVGAEIIAGIWPLATAIQSSEKAAKIAGNDFG